MPCNNEIIKLDKNYFEAFLFFKCLIKTFIFLENHTLVGYPYEKMCSAESLSNCMKSMFFYREEKPLFPDIQTLELAFKTNDDFTGWCGYVKYILFHFWFYFNLSSTVSHSKV